MDERLPISCLSDHEDGRSGTMHLPDVLLTTILDAAHASASHELISQSYNRPLYKSVSANHSSNRRRTSSLPPLARSSPTTHEVSHTPPEQAEVVPYVQVPLSGAGSQMDRDGTCSHETDWSACSSMVSFHSQDSGSAAASTDECEALQGLQLLDLPTELLCKILGLLPYDQRLASATVCLRFSEILRRPHAWPTLMLRARGIYPSPPPLQLTCWLAPRCLFTEEVTLRNFELRSSALLDLLSCAAHNLKSLNLELVTGIQLALPRGTAAHRGPCGPLTALTGLTHLGLRHVECNEFPDVILRMPRLASLDCRPLTSGYPCVWEVPAEITLLQRLRRISLASLTALTLPQAFVHLKGLRDMSIDTVRHIDGGTHLPCCLTSLQVAYCWASAPLGEASLSRLTALQRLRVVSCGRRNLTPSWMTCLKALQEYLVEEDSHEWFINLDVLSQLPLLRHVRLEIDEFLGPAMMYITGTAKAMHRLASAPFLQSFHILRASGISAKSLFVLLGLVHAFNEAGRQLTMVRFSLAVSPGKAARGMSMSYDCSRAMLTHNPDNLDPELLVTRDSYLLLTYGRELPLEPV